MRILLALNQCINLTKYVKFVYKLTDVIAYIIVVYVL